MITRCASRRRDAEKGQMLVVMALMSLLLFGSAALAIDLSSDTHTKRLDQNASDAGALSGARDLNSVVDNTAENSAITNALYAVGLTEGWTATPSTWWASAFTSAVSGGRQAVETHGVYTVTVKTPVPLADLVAGSLCDPGGTVGSNNCIEVFIQNTQSNNFGRFVGLPTAMIGSRSIAYHYGPGMAFPVALYAVNGVLTGNTSESVQGDIYVGKYFQPQASGVGAGKASICAATQAGNPYSGHLLFGYPQPPVGGSFPPQAQVPPQVTYGGACGGGATSLYAEASSGTCDIGTWTPGVGNGICVVQPAMQPPNESAPTVTRGFVTTCSTIDPSSAGFAASFPPGVYEVKHSGCRGNTPDFTIHLNSAPNTLQCYSFVLDDGVTVKLDANKIGGTIEAYNDPTDGCVASSDPQATNVFFAAPTSVVHIVDNGNGCCPSFVLDGSIYAPNTGSDITTSTNTAISVNGQAIIGEWNDQSGAHPGASVTYVQAQAPPITETLKLVQ